MLDEVTDLEDEMSDVEGNFGAALPMGSKNGFVHLPSKFCSNKLLSA